VIRPLDLRDTASTTCCENCAWSVEVERSALLLRSCLTVTAGINVPVASCNREFTGPVAFCLISGMQDLRNACSFSRLKRYYARIALRLDGTRIAQRQEGRVVLWPAKNCIALGYVDADRSARDTSSCILFAFTVEAGKA
jgi:hypothetical protein